MKSPACDRPACRPRVRPSVAVTSAVVIPAAPAPNTTTSYSLANEVSLSRQLRGHFVRLCLALFAFPPGTPLRAWYCSARKCSAAS